MPIGGDYQSTDRQKRWREAREAQRQTEIEAGKAAQRRWAMFEAIDKGEKVLKGAFPTLLIGTLINKPFSHVTIRAERRPKLAPLESRGVLEGEFYLMEPVEFTDPIEGFPSDHLVAQLALIA